MLSPPLNRLPDLYHRNNPFFQPIYLITEIGFSDGIHILCCRIIVSIVRLYFLSVMSELFGSKCEHCSEMPAGDVPSFLFLVESSRLVLRAI